MSNTIIIQQAQAMILLVIANRCDIAAGQNNVLPNSTEFPYQKSSLDPRSPEYDAEQALIQFYNAVYLLLTKETIAEKFFEVVITLLNEIHQNYPRVFEEMTDDPNSNKILIFLYVLDISNHSHMKFKQLPKLMDAFLNKQIDKTIVILDFLSNYFVKPPEILLQMADVHSLMKSIIQQIKYDHEKRNLKNNPIAVWLGQAPIGQDQQFVKIETFEENPTTPAQELDDLLTSFKNIKASVRSNDTENLDLFSEETTSNIAELFLKLSLGSIVLNKIESKLQHSPQKVELTLRCLETLKIGLNRLLGLEKINHLSAYTSILFATIKYSQAFSLYQHPQSPCRQIAQDLAYRFIIQFPMVTPQEGFNNDDMWGLNLALQVLIEDIQFAENNQQPWPLKFISEEQFWLTCGFFIRLATQQPPKISMLYSGIVNKIYKGYEKLGLHFAHSETFIKYKISLCKSMQTIFSIVEEDATSNLPWSLIGYKEGRALWKTSIECLVEEPRAPQLVYHCSMLMEPIVTTLLTFNLFKETKCFIDTFEDFSGIFELHKNFDKQVYSSLGLMLLAFERADYLKNISHFTDKNIIRKIINDTSPQSLQNILINYTLNALLKACADDFIKNDFSSSVLLIEHLISVLDCGKKTDRNTFNIKMVHTKNMIEALNEFIQLLKNLIAGNNVETQLKTKTKTNKPKSLDQNLLSALLNNRIYSYLPLFCDAIVHYLIEQTKHFFNSSAKDSYSDHNALVVRYNQIKPLLDYLYISSEQLDSLAAAFRLDGLEKKRSAIELSLLAYDENTKTSLAKKKKKKKKKKSSQYSSSALPNNDGSDLDVEDANLECSSPHRELINRKVSEATEIDKATEITTSDHLLIQNVDNKESFEPANDDDGWTTIESNIKSRKSSNRPKNADTSNLRMTSPHPTKTSQAKSLTLLQVATIKGSPSSTTKPSAKSTDPLLDNKQDKANNTHSSFAWAKPLNVSTARIETERFDLETTKKTDELNESEASVSNVTLTPVQATLSISPKSSSNQLTVPDHENNQDKLISMNLEVTQNISFPPLQNELVVAFLPKPLYENVFTFIPVSQLPEEFELLEIINHAFLTFYQEKNRSGMPLVVTGKTVSNFYTRIRPNDLDCSGYNITLIEQEEILRILAKQHGWGDRSIHGIVGTKHKILLCKIPYKGREIKVDLSYLPPKKHGQTLLQPLFDDAAKRDKLSTAYHLVMYRDKNSNCYPILNALKLAAIVLPTGHLKSYLDNDILEINSLLDQTIKQNSAFTQNIFSQDPMRILRFIQDIAENPSIMIGQYLQSYLPSFSNQIAQNNFWYQFLSTPAQSPSKRTQTFFSTGMTLSQGQLSTKLQQMFSKFSHSYEHTQFLYELLDRYGVLIGVINAAVLNFDRANQIERMPEQRMTLVMLVKEEVIRTNTFSNHIPYSSLFQLIANINSHQPHLFSIPNVHVATP